MTQCEILALAAQKGGVLKSTSAVNLATGLARASWRVLLCDTDAQANSTSMFLPDEETETTLYEVVTGRSSAKDAIVPTRIDNLSLLPSSLDVARLDTELVAMHRREAKLIEALEPILDDYDAVVLDLPPNLSPMTIASLAAATAFITPTDPSRWGMRGLELLLSWVDDLRAARVLEAEFLGVLLTRVESGTVMLRETRQQLAESKMPVFDAYIPKRAGGEKMIARRQVIGDQGADPDVDEAYAQFTVEVVHKLAELRARRSKHAKSASA